MKREGKASVFVPSVTGVISRLRRARGRLEWIPFTVATALLVGHVLAPMTGVHRPPEVVSLFTEQRAAPLVIAHRGDVSAAPENTEVAVRQALMAGVDVIEVDVQLSADGVPVLMHDSTVNRTTDGTGPVWQYTAAELATFRVRADSTEDFAGVGVPTLGQVAALMKSGQVALMVELKGVWTGEGLAAAAEALERAGMSERSVLASFDVTTLEQAAVAQPELPRLLLMRHVGEDQIAIAQGLGAIAVGAPRSVLAQAPEFVATAAEAGLATTVFTVNGEEPWSLAADLGVAGIITDEPRLLGSWLARRS